jgi:hypothetical protein
MRNYNETDLAFYSEEELTDVEVNVSQYGYTLKWNKVEGVSGYAVYRSVVEESGLELLRTVDENTHEFIDNLPSTQQIYFYKVFALIEGDLIIGEENIEGLCDLALTKDYDSARQDITNRVRTQTGDWRSHPKIGGDLELLEGEPNTRETGMQGVEQIRQTLTFDGRFLDNDLSIRPVPTTIESIDYYTMVDTDDNEPILVKNSLEL